MWTTPTPLPTMVALNGKRREGLPPYYSRRLPGLFLKILWAESLRTRRSCGTFARPISWATAIVSPNQRISGQHIGFRSDIWQRALLWLNMKTMRLVRPSRPPRPRALSLKWAVFSYLDRVRGNCHQRIPG